MPSVWSLGRPHFCGGDNYWKVLSKKRDLYRPSGAYNFDVAFRILTNLCNPVSKV